jgi:hypothetical protein
MRVMTTVTKSSGREAEYTSAQLRTIDREIAKGLEDVRKGRVHGPFNGSEAEKFLKTELKTRAEKSKSK